MDMISPRGTDVPPAGDEARQVSEDSAGGSRYSSDELFKGRKEITIEHQGADYRLRITRTGGLILNK